MFLVVEGMDGSGKTTALSFIKDYLVTKTGVPCTVTREPGGTQLGDMLRALLLGKDVPLCLEATALLMMAAREQHIAEVILPAVQRGDHVVSDRFYLSTLVYQNGSHWAAKAANASIRPDLTLFFRVSPETAQQRISKRDGSSAPDRFDSVSKDATAFDRYDEICKHSSRVKVIDADGSLADVQRNIVRALDYYFCHAIPN